MVGCRVVWRILSQSERVLVLKTQISQRLFCSTRLELTPDNPLYYTRYGYAALLGITLFGGLLLNGWVQHKALSKKESPYMKNVSMYGMVSRPQQYMLVLPASTNVLV